MPDQRELSEDEAWEIAVNDHPEYKRALDEDTLPDETVDEDGNVTSPMMHLSMHAVVERQIATDEPAGVAAIADALSERGVDRHEIRHVIARPLAEQIWYMQKEECPFDEKRYLSDLRKIVAQFD